MARYWADRLAAVQPWVVGQTAPPYRIVDGDAVRVIHPRVISWNDPPEDVPDVVLLSTKWRRMPTAHDWIASWAPTSLVLSLMNGMGQEEALQDIPGIAVASGTTTAAATRDDQQSPTIVVNSHGETWLPSISDPREEWLITASHTYSWGWEWVDATAMAAIRWQKLLQNSIINPLTALANCLNGDLPRHPLWKAAPRLVAEARQVAQASGIDMPENMLEHVLALLEATAGNLSSTTQDVRAGLPTELGAITGYIVRQARRRSFSAPTHEALLTLFSAFPSQIDNPTSSE